MTFYISAIEQMKGISMRYKKGRKPPLRREEFSLP
jgi:hypothetical protein